MPKPTNLCVTALGYRPSSSQIQQLQISTEVNVCMVVCISSLSERSHSDKEKRAHHALAHHRLASSTSTQMEELQDAPVLEHHGFQPRPRPGSSSSADPTHEPHKFHERAFASACLRPVHTRDKPASETPEISAPASSTMCSSCGPSAPEGATLLSGTAIPFGGRSLLVALFPLAQKHGSPPCSAEEGRMHSR